MPLSARAKSMISWAVIGGVASLGGYFIGKIGYRYTREIYMTSRKRNETDAFTVKKINDALAALYADPHCRSLLKKHLGAISPRELERLKHRKTILGATLYDIIRSGVANHDDPVGVYAADVESYKLFNSLFDPIIRELHPSMPSNRAHKREKNGTSVTASFEDLDPEYVLSTRLESRRSIKGYPFAPLLTGDDYLITEAKVKEVLKAMNEAVDEVSEDLKGAYYSLQWMSDEEREKLRSANLLFDDGDRYLKSARSYEYWPQGRGVYVNEDGTLVIRVNEEDHLRFTSEELGSKFGQAFDRLQRSLKAFESERMKFNRDDKLGWLTMSPRNLASSVLASVKVKLPELSSSPDELKALCKEKGLEVHEVDPDGGIYQLSNSKTVLGRTDSDGVAETLRSFYDAVRQLIEVEKGKALKGDGSN